MGDNRPTISVVLPTYNRAGIIGRSVETVLDQTYSDFELLVVDDASSDDTEDRIDDIDDDRIRYVKHQKNRGAAAARNTGIRKAVGDIVAFQDSDDLWKEDKLQKQITVFENTDDSVGVVYTGTRREIDGSSSYLPGPAVDPKEGDVRNSLYDQNFIPTQAAAVRAECFDCVGTFDERTPPISDWEMWIRIAQEYKFRLVDEPLVLASVRPDSISNRDVEKVESREYIVRKHWDQFPPDKLAKQLFWIGHGYTKFGNSTAGRRYLMEAIKTDPRLVYIASSILSLFGPRFYRSVYRRYKAVG